MRMLRRVLAGVGVFALTLGVAGCARPVSVDAGKFAPDPLCGAVIQALPRELFGLREVKTTAQSTFAWGTSDAAVTMRCGVENPPPTEDRCIGVTSNLGVTIDWINPEAGSDLIPPHGKHASGGWVFITYGRTPAIEVVVPAIVNLEPADVLQAISTAVEIAPAERFCVAFTDVTMYGGEQPSDDGATEGAG